MRRHAKASSAGSISGRGGSLGSLGCAFATRDTSHTSKGSCAPSHARARVSLLALAVAAIFLLALAPSAFASKGVISWVGSFGSQGGQFSTASGVAVNTTGAGGATAGDIYVADTFNNRIQQFKADGTFVRAWGFDVITSGKGGDLGNNVFEVCTVAADCKSGINSVSPAPGGELSSPRGVAIDQSTGAVYVTDQNFLRVQKFSATGSFERAWGQDVVQSGKPEDSPATSAKQNLKVEATAGQFKLTFKGQTTSDLEWNASSATVQTALQALSTIGAGNATVSGGPGDELGTTPYLITFAGALANSPQAPITTTVGTTPLSGGAATAAVTNNTTGSSGFEVCTTAANCKTGVSGATAGAFASEFSSQLAVAPVGSPNAGRVIVADRANRRVQEFSSAGAFIDAFGFDVAASPTGTGTSFEVCSAANFDVCKIAAASGTGNGQFANNSPNRVAVDDAGRIYAADTNNNRVQRFTSTPAFDTLYGTTQLSGEPAPADIAIDPGAVSAGDASDDHVFVIKPCNGTLCPSGSLPPPFSTTERRIKELGTAADPALIDTHVSGAGITNVNGLAINTTSERLFASSFSGGERVYFVDNALAAPVPVTDPITTKTDTTATFTGTVDPKGGNVTCKFQYSTDQSNWTDLAIPGSCSTLSNGGGAQAVSASVTGLVPNTNYAVRLYVTRAFPPLQTTTSFARFFDTDAPAPVVSNVGAVQVTDSSARLVGTIDPKHSPTSYVFEYGTTPSLGSSTTPLNIGSGSTPLTVSRVIGGLAPDTTYYFRMAATNLTGPTASTNFTFHTRATPLPLPDERAYEMVSPPDKNLGSVNLNAIQLPTYNVSSDGNSVGFCPYAVFGDPPSQMTQFCAPYVSQRGATGWTTINPVPPYCRYDFSGTEAAARAEVFLSADHAHAAFLMPEMEPASCDRPPLVAGAFIPARNLYVENLTGSPDYALATPFKSWGPGGGGSMGPASYPVGASEDFSHLVYTDHFNQTAPPDSPPANNLQKVYQWLKQGEDGCAALGGCVTLVSKDTGNIPFETASNYPDVFEGNNQPNRATSTDGERIYFQNPVASSENNTDTGQCLATCEIYMRKNAATTIDISASECTLGPAVCGTPGNSADFFRWATPSGEMAFFVSCAKLTDESPPDVACGNSGGSPGHSVTAAPGSKLYRWDENAPPGHHLVDVSLDHEPADGVQPSLSPGGVAMIGVSDDGNTVFFATNGQLVAGAPLATAGSKIYRWRWNGGNPDLDYLGAFTTIQGYTEKSEVAKAGTLSQRWVSPDGKYLLVETRGNQLDPVADQDANRDVYRWDEANGWQCASCQLPGAPSAGSSTILPAFEGTVHNAFFGGHLYGGALKTSMTDDGRVFFTTPDALVPEDVNGEAGCTSSFAFGEDNETFTCQDLYEWNEGAVSLVSSGTGSEATKFAGTTPSGDDVFFYTRDRLVGWDKDNGIDFYDARVGGGYPEPPAQPPTCEGEACRGEGTAAPNSPGAGTGVFDGPGDQSRSLTRPCRRGLVKRNGRCVKKKRSSKRRQHRTANNNRRAGR